MEVTELASLIESAQLSPEHLAEAQRILAEATGGLTLNAKTELLSILHESLASAKTEEAHFAQLGHLITELKTIAE